jgi:hypothetical protein
MPSPTTCNEIFNAARANRANHPLTSGQYKLREAEDTLNAWRVLVLEIAKRLRTKAKLDETECLGPCLTTERGTYLKSIPARLAELIGHNILPAIAALEGDGLPKADVQRLLSLAETDAQRLLDDCEALRLRLRGGIKHEYRAMRRGESLLLGLLVKAEALTSLP